MQIHHSRMNCQYKDPREVKPVPDTDNIATVIYVGTADAVVIHHPLATFRTSSFVETLLALKALNCPVQVIY